MHLLKFKTGDKKENNENEPPNFTADNIIPEVKKTDNQTQGSPNEGKDHEKDTIESPQSNKTYQEAAPDIPPRQELIQVFEELAAFIYQLEYDRGVKDDSISNRQMN